MDDIQNIAFVFPGQGTQYVGMGRDIAEKYPEAKEVYEIANEVMKMDIRKLCFEGPKEEIIKTENQQPTILTTEIAILRVLEKHGIKPDVTAGFSLGEYSALIYAEALKFEEAVKLVRKRGLFMENAVPFGEGKMVAIIGLSRQEILSIVEDSSDKGLIECSNFNCPGQIIVSGKAAAVEKAAKLANQRGAKKVDFLNVSGPFHTSLLLPAGLKLREELENINVDKLKKKYVTNVTGEFVSEDEDIREILKQHVYKPVLWEDSVDTMILNGIDTFIEVGPKNVLTNFNKRIAKKHNKDIQCYNIENIDTLEKLINDSDKILT